MPCLAVLCLIGLAMPALNPFGDKAPSTQPGDPMAESRRIDEAIRKLSESTPVCQEVHALTKQIDGMHAQFDQQAEPLANQQRKLMDTPAYQEYVRKYEELREQQKDRWDSERKAMAAVAKQLYAARHEELRQIAPVDIPQGRALGFDVLNFPRLDGSTSTHPLSVILAARLLNIPYQWLYPEPTGSPWREVDELYGRYYLDIFSERERDHDFDLAASRVVAIAAPAASQPATPAPPAAQRVALLINSLLAVNTSTHNAYVNLIDGKCDLNLSARPPSASELTLAREKNVRLAWQPIARDALVFIVHHDNPVPSLTTRQLQDIYQDRIKLWKEVVDPARLQKWPGTRGVQSSIRALHREPESGSRELFDALLMNGLPAPDAKTTGVRMLYSSLMSSVFNRVVQESPALGYSVYYYEHFMALSPYTRTLAVDGVEPAYDTIASGKYPFTTPVYVAYRETDAPDSPGMKMLRWLLSPEGQAVIREAGYVPIH